MDPTSVDLLAWSRDLYAISQARSDQGEALERILSHVISGFDADGGYLALPAGTDGQLTVVASRNFPDACCGQPLHMPTALGVREPDGTLRHGATRDSLMCNDALHMFLPLISEGRLGGALLAHRESRRDPFGYTDFQRGSIMVSLLSVVIDNRQLHADQDRRIEELSRINEEFRQINERLENAQNQLIQSEKMASIGQLAAGVAHEINNPIGYVHSNLGTLEDYVRDLFGLLDGYARAAERAGVESFLRDTEALRRRTDVEFLREDVDALFGEVREGITRVRKIVRELKDFSHAGAEDEWLPADLHQGLDSTLAIVNNEIKYKAEVVRDYGDLPPVWCQPSQLNQVFLNLLVNAAHAIEKNGRIAVRTRVDGDTVAVSVSDTGHGIKPEHLNRIFDPFFTTKPVGKGTGLGLSLSYGIVKKHGGTIDVASGPEGTTFTVRLPCRKEAVLAKESEVISHA
jgi:signal transduction histidine kinase